MELSIVIPVYNVEKYIRKCLLSVVNQTLQEIEIVIVNDGTKDKSIDIIQDIIESDNRIKLINKANGGLMSAWIEGVKNSIGKYIGFVDSDDWVDNDFFECLLDRIKETNSDLIVGKYVADDGLTRKELYRSKDRTYEGDEIKQLLNDYFNSIIYEENIISYCRWDKLYKRELLLENFKYLDTRISLGEDVNTNTAVIPDCKRITVLAKTPYYHYRTNQQSIVNTFNPKQINNIAVLYNALEMIMNTKHLDKEPMYYFVADMIFNQIKTILDNKCENRDEYCDLINSYENASWLLEKYGEKKSVFHKIFIALFRKRKYLLCSSLNTLYGLKNK